MNASELRIGNWVMNPEGTPGQVTELAFVTGGEEDCIETTANDYLLYGYQIAPIPLTPEILEGCGFVKLPEVDQPIRGNAVCYHFDFSDKISGENRHAFSGVAYADKAIGYYLVNQHWASVDILHLHQLQNLHFALTGEELQVDISRFANKEKEREPEEFQYQIPILPPIYDNEFAGLLFSKEPLIIPGPTSDDIAELHRLFDLVKQDETLLPPDREYYLTKIKLAKDHRGWYIYGTNQTAS